MKKAIQLLLMYFILLFSTIIFGTLIYSVYLNILNFVAGKDFNLFNNYDLLKSLFFVTYCALFLIGPFLSYYRIRFTGGVPQTIVYALLILITWGLFFPGVIFLERIYESNSKITRIENRLSGNYFRKDGTKVYYFTRDFYSDPISFDDTTTVIIDTKDNGSVTVEKIKEQDDFELIKDAAPYKDILIKNTFNSHRIPYFLDFGVLIQKGKADFAKGWTFYLGFCSMGLLLGSVYALSNYFAWKMISACLLVCVTTAIYILNSLTAGGYLSKLVAKTEQIGFVAKLTNIFDNPFLVFVNTLLSLILIIVGIIIFAIRQHHKKASGR